MKKKILPLILASSLALGATFTLASCGGKGKAEELLKNLIVQEAGTTVDQDFKVAATMKDGEEEYNLLWTSSNTNVLKVADEAYEKSYTVTVILPEENQETVVLTATLDINGDKATKDFTFYVDPISVYNISDAYKFKQDGAIVAEDFKLDTEASFGTKKATITWESLTPELVTIDSSTNTAKVTNVAPAQQAKLRATFTYDGTTTKKTFKFNVYRKLTAFEQLKYWYEHTGVSQELTGYVVAKDKYDAGFGNTAFYIANDQLDGGYYAYRVKCDQATYDAITFGTHVTVSGATNTAYNGLMETNAGGTIAISKDVAKKTEAELIKAIDEEFIANVDSLYYRSSQLVSLTGWKVKAITDDAKKAESYGAAADLITLTKGGVDIKVVSSKYVILTDDAKTGLLNAISGLSVGDYVDIKGVLGFNGTPYKQDAYRINVTQADSVVKHADYDASGDTALADNAKAVGKATHDLTFGNVYQAKEIELPATVNGCAVTWSFSTTADIYDPKTAEISGDKLVINPADTEEEIVLVGTFTKGTFTAKQYYTFNTLAKTDEELIADEVSEFNFKDVIYTGEYELPEKGKLYNIVDMAYEIVSQKNKANEDVNITSIAGGKLIIGPVNPGDTHTIVVKVTFTYGTAEKEKEYTIVVNNEKIVNNIVQTSIDESKTYLLGINQKNLGKELYFTGAVSGNYLATTADYTKAAEVHVKANTDGTYYLYVLDGDKKTYIALAPLTNKLGANATLTEDPFAWKWNSTYNTFAAEVKYNDDKADFYIGTYNAFDTISASNISYAKTSFPCNLLQVEMLDYTKEQKANYENDHFSFEEDQKSTDSYTLPKAGLFKDVTITYTVDDSDTTGTTIEDGVITFGAIASDATVKVNVTFTCGEKTATKQITFNVSPLVFMTPTEVVEGTKGDNPTIAEGTVVYVTGVVTKVTATGNNPYCYIFDGENEFEVYGTVAEGSALDYSDVSVGDVVFATGKYTYYAAQQVHETSKGSARILSKGEATDDQKATITAAKLTVKETYDTNGNYNLPTTGTLFTDTTITWSLVGTSTTATLADNVLTITQGDADEEVTLKATIKSGEVEVEKEIKVTVKKVSATKTVTTTNVSATIAYNTTPVMTYGTDYAENLGLDTSIFDVVTIKGDGNGVAFYNSDIRIYWKNAADNTNLGGVTYSVATGYRIDSVVVTFTSDTYGANAKVLVGSAEVTKADGAYAINGSSFTIVNAAEESAQVRVKSVSITYTKLS